MIWRGGGVLMIWRGDGVVAAPRNWFLARVSSD